MSSDPYDSPNVPSAPPRRNWRDYASQYNGAFWTGLKIQAGLAVLTALILDGGQIHRAFWVAFLCQWATVWMILVRRPTSPTQLDLAIVRYGVIPLLIVVAGCGPPLLAVLGIQSS